MRESKESQQRQHAEREHFFRATWVVAGITMLSRLLGMARDMAMLAFGASRWTDAFWTAFRVPNLFRRLFGEGALAASFVPVFTEMAEAHGLERARRVLANVAGVLALTLAGILVAGELALVGWLATRPAPDWQLLGQLTMVMLPFMFTVCLLALGSAALNCRGHFAYPAFAPILLNVFLLAGAWAGGRLFGADRERLFVLSCSVVVAGLVQLAGVLWLLRSAGLAVVPRLRPLLAGTRRVARLALPMMIPLGVLQFSALFDSLYAWLMSATEQSPSLELFGLTIAKPLSPGVVTRLYAASRLYQFPLGVLAISVATAVFPLLSRYASRGDVEGLRQTTNRALRLSLFMGVPAGVGLMLLARPAIVLIFQHGRFAAADVAAAAPILQMYCLGMWAYFCNHILLRAFFAQKDTRTPLIIACSLAGVNMVGVVTLVFTPLRAAAVGLASACTASINVVLLVWVLRRRWGRLGGREIASSLLRTLAAAGALAGAVMAVRVWLGPVAGGMGTKTGAGLVVAGGVAAGAGAFLGAAVLLRCPELKELRARPHRTGPAEA